MGSIDGHRFTVWKYSYVIPVDLAVSERWTTMILALFQKVIPGSISWRCKKMPSLPSRIIKTDRLVLFLVGLNVGQKAGGLPVASVLGIPPIVIAYAIRGVPVAIPPQVGLDGLFAGTMGLGFHQVLAAGNTRIAATLGGRCHGREKEGCTK